ncbi:MAG: hypothetical protein NTZ95_07960 [Candidatus Omnitrophica bacterium]|nr:hypothetical protein [Candidatus Omnitrophota bacterium]
MDALEKIRAILAAEIKDKTNDETFGRTYKERFQIPLFIAFILLAADLFLKTINQSKKR